MHEKGSPIPVTAPIGQGQTIDDNMGAAAYNKDSILTIAADGKSAAIDEDICGYLRQ